MAACVLGGVRLISSARMTLANSGPFKNLNSRAPVSGFWKMTSVPVMSEGIRSEVNWIRLKFMFKVCAKVEMSSVLARPGTPTSSAWLRVTMAINNWSITSCWPTITLANSRLMAA